MEVSVSPRATTWLLPFAPAGCAETSGAGAIVDVGVTDVEVTGELSPAVVLDREPESCCSSFKICCESRSIFAFCSSIFFVRISICATFEMDGAGERARVCAETEEANAADKKSATKICAQSFMGRDFDICRFFWQARVNLPLPGFPLNFLPCRSAFKSRWTRCRGDRNKAMAVGRGRPTSRGRTRKIS